MPGDSFGKDDFKYLYRFNHSYARDEYSTRPAYMQ